LPEFVDQFLTKAYTRENLVACLSSVESARAMNWQEREFTSREQG
jgi:hypothetical protein